MTSTTMRLSDINEDGVRKPVDESSKLRDTEIDVEIMNGESGDFDGIDDGLLPDPQPTPPPVPKRPDINLYQQKKTLAQGMMDVALLTANANQLRIALERESDDYYLANVVLISLSIFIQVLIGVCLIWNSSYNVTKGIQFRAANRVNNVTVIGVFIVTVLNVFISAFGVSVVPSVSASTSLAVK